MLLLVANQKKTANDELASPLICLLTLFVVVSSIKIKQKRLHIPKQLLGRAPIWQQLPKCAVMTLLFWANWDLHRVLGMSKEEKLHKDTAGVIFAVSNFFFFYIYILFVCLFFPGGTLHLLPQICW